MKEMSASLRNYAEKDARACIDVMVKSLGSGARKPATADFMLGLDSPAPVPGMYSSFKRKVALMKGKIVGVGGVYRLNGTPKGFVGIDWFGVLPGYQGMGIGRKLLLWMIKEAKREKAKYLFVWSAEGAMPFYKKAGFRKSSKKIRPREWTTLMVKKL